MIRFALINHFHSRIDEGQTALVNAFQTMKGRDKDRCLVAKDLSLKSVGML